MIIYDLSCENEHRFEGWFRDGNEFETQLSQRFLTCPQCNSHVVRRIPSAVAIGSGAHVPDTAQKNANAPMSMDDALALYQRLTDYLLTQSEDVGSQFAAEARRIHYNEAPHRAIRGQTSDDEYEALEDEGIEVMRIPVVRKKPLN